MLWCESANLRILKGSQRPLGTRHHEGIEGCPPGTIHQQILFYTAVVSSDHKASHATSFSEIYHGHRIMCSRLEGHGQGSGVYRYAVDVGYIPILLQHYPRLKMVIL